MPEILKPANEAETASIVKEIVDGGQSLEIIGGGSKAGFGHPSVASHRISTQALTGITLYEPGALTLVAGAGTPLADIERQLAENGQHLPFEPANYADLLGNSGSPTIGGVVACAISGPRRIQAGACRDSLIGVKFVNGEGEPIKNGGRVMKNVTGYDLVKLLCGSHGTLGILTEVSFKLLPKPECSNALQVFTNDIATAVTAMSAALTSPYDVTGAAYLPHPQDQPPHVLIRVEGFETSVAYRTKRLKELLAAHGEVDSLDDDSVRHWTAVREVTPFAGVPGAVWRISVKPTDAPAIANMLATFEETQTLYDWGGGLIWARVPETGDCGNAALRPAVDRVGGHATLVRATEETRAKVPVFHPQHPGIEAISKSIKAGFDPVNGLNPGRMGV